MPINSDFLIKHVRPVDVDAVDAIFSPNFQAYLQTTLGMTDDQLVELVQAWATTAGGKPGPNVAAFVTAADAVTQGRWSEHSQTKVNTVFFLNRDQLTMLSEVGNRENAGRTFVADFSGDRIAVAVDINKDGTFVVRRNVAGMNVTTDGTGNICHLNPPPKGAAAPKAAPASPAAAPLAPPAAARSDPTTAGLNAVLDLSHNNGTLTVADFVKARAAGIRAVFHKATQGIGFADPMLVPHLTAARSAGLHIGAYHFGNATDPADQLAFFADTVRASGLGPMPLVLDYETNATPQTSMSVQQARIFLQRAQARFGRAIGLYSGITVRQALRDAKDPVLGASWLWLPAYGSDPVVQPSWSRWTLWQYTDGTAGPPPHGDTGIDRPIDRSVFAGDAAALDAFWRAEAVSA